MTDESPLYRCPEPLSMWETWSRGDRVGFIIALACIAWVPFLLFASGWIKGEGP